jgi:hypothetical protein
LEAPPKDVTFCLQRGRDELVSPARATCRLLGDGWGIVSVKD